MFRFFRRFKDRVEKAESEGALKDRGAGKSMTPEEQLEAAQRTFVVFAMLNGHDPFTGELRFPLPFMRFGGNVERRDTS